MTGPKKRLWIGLLVLALLTPLGVILPEKFRAGGAWGEWGPKELKRLVGYMPGGLRKMADLWKAPLPDYSLGSEKASTAVHILSYIASGLIGISAIALVIYLIARVTIGNGK